MAFILVKSQRRGSEAAAGAQVTGAGVHRDIAT
jgi:hypothetical protein